MSTVNFECDYCNQLIAVSRDHLGQHVQCPHCQQVVQAPSDAPAEDASAPKEAPAAARDHEPEFSAKPAAEQESIFSPADEDLSDDVFGSSAKKQTVEMPTEPAPHPEGKPTHGVSSFYRDQEQEDGKTIGYMESSPAPLDFAASYTPTTSAAVGFVDAGHVPGETLPSQETELPRPTIRQPAKGGFLGTMLLIFLIPYALVTSGCIAYLIYLLNVERNKPAPPDPLERLLDPNPKEEKGGPRRVKHDSPLPDKLKTTFNQSLKIGDVEVTPRKVLRQGDHLKLLLEIQNVSTNIALNPLPAFFVDTQSKGAEQRPYTFLQIGDYHVYGASLSYEREPKRPGRFDGVLHPGESVVLGLETTLNKRGAELLAKFGDKLLWRVQVRRGFVEVKGKEVSATALVGVEFRKDEIGESQGAQLKRPPIIGAGFGWNPISFVF